MVLIPSPAPQSVAFGYFVVDYVNLWCFFIKLLTCGTLMVGCGSLQLFIVTYGTHY